MQYHHYLMRVHRTWYRGVMRTTVDIPEPLLKDAKKVASEKSATLSSVVEEALRGYLTRKTTTNAAPFRLYTVRGKLVNPDIDLDRTGELIVAEDEADFKGQK